MKTKLFSTIALIMMLLSQGVFADNDQVTAETAKPSQCTSINGRIVDAESGEFLVGVLVKLEGTDKVAYTDFDGKYSFDQVPKGSYSVQVEYVSYEKKSSETFNTEENNTVDIKLQAAK